MFWGLLLIFRETKFRICAGTKWYVAGKARSGHCNSTYQQKKESSSYVPSLLMAISKRKLLSTVTRSNQINWLFSWPLSFFYSRTSCWRGLRVSTFWRVSYRRASRWKKEKNSSRIWPLYCHTLVKYVNSKFQDLPAEILIQPFWRGLRVCTCKLPREYWWSASVGTHWMMCTPKFCSSAVS